MIENNEIYEIVQDMAQKAKHGAITVSQYNKYANMANIDLFNERLGATRDYYKLGKAIAKTGVGMNKALDQSLKVFLVPDASVVVVNGKADVPANCEYIDSVTFNNKSVKWIPKAKLPEYLNSTIDNPTEEYPIYCDLASQIEIHPSTITPILLSYYRTPVEVEWKYNIVNRRPVYNPTGTVNFEWDATHKMELITRILGYIGITIRDGDLLNYAITEENTIA